MSQQSGAKLLEQVTEMEQRPATSPIGIALSDGADKILDASSKSIDQIFDYAMQRISKVRHACDMAEEAVKTKRRGVQEALEGYVESLQMVETSTTDMQKLIGEVLVASDRLGGI